MKFSAEPQSGKSELFSCRQGIQIAVGRKDRRRQNGGKKIAFVSLGPFRRGWIMISIHEWTPNIEGRYDVPTSSKDGVCERLTRVSRQVGRRVGRHAVRPLHAVSAAGARGRRRRLSGVQDDQPHEARRLHRHREYDLCSGSDGSDPYLGEQ